MPVGLVQLKKFVGVNLSVQPRDLGDNELAWSRNMHPVQADGGELRIRLNSQWLLQKDYSVDDGDKVKIFPIQAGGKQHVILWEAPGSWLWYDTDAGQFTHFGIFPENGPDKPCIVQWQNRVYALTGATQGYTIIYNPAFVLPRPPFYMEKMTESYRWGPNAPRARVGAVYQGSMLLSGFGKEEESLVRWTEVGNPEVILNDSKSLFIDRGIGGDINGAFEVAVEGGDEYIKTYGMILKPGGMWVMQGRPPTSTDEGDLQITNLNEEQGLISRETIAKTPYGQIWCSGGNVWLAPIGQKPVRIGEPIRPLLETLPQVPELWHAVYQGGFYRLVVPALSQDGGPYPAVEQWWCDLRNYPTKIAWWGPMELPSDSMLAVGPPGNLRRLLSVVQRQVTDGKKIDLEELEVPTPGRHDHSGVPDDNVPMKDPEGEIRFRELDGGDPFPKKIVQAVDVHARFDVPANVEVRLVGDGGGNTSGQTQEPVPNGKFVLGESALGNAVSLGAGFRSVAFTPPAGRRFLARVFQPVVKLRSLGNVSSDIRFRELALRVRVFGSRPRTKKEEAD